MGARKMCHGSKIQLSSPVHTVHNWLGERERANLVVQLARFLYPALMYAVMFYVTLNKRKRLGDCVTFSYLRCTYRNVSKYALHACHASRGEMSRSG